MFSGWLPPMLKAEVGWSEDTRASQPEFAAALPLTSSVPDACLFRAKMQAVPGPTWPTARTRTVAPFWPTTLRKNVGTLRVTTASTALVLPASLPDNGG